MKIPLGHIADLVDGRLVGSPDKLLSDVALVDEATCDQITFVDDRQTLAALDDEALFPAGAVIVPANYVGRRSNLVKVDNPQLAFLKTIKLFHPPSRVQPHTSPTAEIHPTARLGQDVFIGPFVSIGAGSVIGDRVVLRAGAMIGEGVAVGADTTLGFHAVVHDQTQVGARVIIQSGAVIGAQGLGHVMDGAKLHKIPHVGCVVIRDDVEIGANTTIDRANVGQTLLESGVQVGNQVHIGHNVTVGKSTRIVDQAGVAGNTVIGAGVTIGGQAGLECDLAIGDDATIGPQAGIISDVASGEELYGAPGMPRRAWLRSALLIPRLSEMEKDLKRLAQRLAALETKARDQEGENAPLES